MEACASLVGSAHDRRSSPRTGNVQVIQRWKASAFWQLQKGIGDTTACG